MADQYKLSENVRDTHTLKKGLYPTRVEVPGIGVLDLRNIPPKLVKPLEKAGVLIPKNTPDKKAPSKKGKESG